MGIRRPKALRDIDRIAASLGLVGEWREGTKHHRLLIDGEQAVVVSKGGNSLPDPVVMRQRLTQFQRSHAPRS